MEQKTTKELIKIDKLGEEYYLINHKSGLKIYLYPQRDYHSSYCLIGTNFGSINNSFKVGDEKEFTKVPDGIAHYAEHKLFESEDGVDAFVKYAKYGACANAYTSFDRTCYLFSCTSNFKESLGVLLDTVTHPYFTEENVEKERGIIGQEIEMYNDDPFWRVYFNLLVAAFKNHPLRTDIAGSVSSIKDITPELLYRCYNSYYSLNNMVLAAAGNIDVDEAIEVFDKYLLPKEKVNVTNEKFEEPIEVNQKEIKQKLPVNLELYQIGYKGKGGYFKGNPALRVVDSILANIIIDETTDLYNELYLDGIINGNFGADLMVGDDYSILIFSGEGEKVYDVKSALDKRIESLKKNGIDETEFNRIKKTLYNATVSALSNTEKAASFFLEAGLQGVSPNELIDASFNVTKEMVYERLMENYDTERSCVSIVHP